MSSKKRPVSASFKRSDDGRSRPNSARSNASTRLSTSFRSEVSGISGLSVTGIKSSQSKPRLKQSLGLSVDKSLTSSQKPFKSSKTKIQKSKAENDSTLYQEPTRNIKSDLNESFDAEKEDHWWENIPDDINFSPHTSFASSKLTDVADNKSKITTVSSSVRNPSLNDFLDFTNDIIQQDNITQNHHNVPQKVTSDHQHSIDNQHGTLSDDLSDVLIKKSEMNIDNSNQNNDFKLSERSVGSSMNNEERLLSQQGKNEREMKAAITIQRYYKGYKTRVDNSHNTIQRMLEEKKMLRETRMKEEAFLTSNDEKQQRREEKARLARHAAIQELNQKRERKKEASKKLMENEMKFLEESGNVIKAKDKVLKTKKERKKKVISNNDNSSVISCEQSTTSSSMTLNDQSEELAQKEQSSENRPNDVVSEANTSRTEETVKTSVTKTTLEDLFESLRELEKEPLEVKDDKKTSQKRDLYDWEKPDFESRPNQSDVPGFKLTQESLRNSSSVLPHEKLRSIISFLDEVEQTDQDTVVSCLKESPKTFGEASPSVSMNLARVDAEKELALLESASAVASDVTNAMMSVKVELEEKKKTGEMLQRALNQQREFSLRQARDMEKDAKQRLDLQRQEYEGTIQRHLSFIDQLIDDKKILSERCEELVKKLKETDKKYVDKIQTMEGSHASEMKKQKDIMTTAEKLRREKWVKEKSQQIKELTVKGLEPDIQKLIAKHKAELKKLKSVHQGELLEADERAGRRYLHQIEELRDQLEREKDSACNRERELAQTRFQKQMEEEEQSFQQQRRRLYAELQEEKERMAEQGQKQRQELDQLRTKLQEEHKISMENVELSSKRLVQDMQKKHETEMKDLKERLEIEKQQWIENYMKKQDAMLLQKERELKEGVRESRDKEIEMVICRLEEETRLARDECERAAENRIKRVRNKYESEIKELEKSEKTMHDKYTTLKERNNEFEEEISRLKSSLNNEERKMEDLKKLAEQLQNERSHVVDIIRQEFADRLVTTDEDNKRLKIEMSELRAKHRLEMEKINNLKEEEMEEVHKRVKQAISKKEETLNTLKQQKESAEKRADHLEYLLQEQRKKLLS